MLMQVYVCISLSVCQDTGVTLCQYVGMSVFQCVSVSVCQCVSVSVCQCINIMSVCQYCVSVSVCQCISVSVCQYCVNVSILCQCDSVSVTVSVSVYQYTSASVTVSMLFHPSIRAKKIISTFSKLICSLLEGSCSAEFKYTYYSSWKGRGDGKSAEIFKTERK